MELLIQYADIGTEEVVGRLAIITGAGTETISTACGYVQALLGDT